MSSEVTSWSRASVSGVLSVATSLMDSSAASALAGSGEGDFA